MAEPISAALSVAWSIIQAIGKVIDQFEQTRADARAFKVYFETLSSNSEDPSHVQVFYWADATEAGNMVPRDGQRGPQRTRLGAIPTNHKSP